jgi:hypothetical protein
MKTQSPSLPWKEARRKKIFFSAAMLFLLIVSALFFYFARQRLNRIESEAFIESRAFQDALRTEVDTLNRKRLAESAEKLLKGAARRGLVPENWAARRINLRQVSLSRTDVNELIYSIARTDSRFFNVEEFEVAVTRDEDGLFSLPARANSPLTMTVQGTLIFQAKDGAR